jgi:HSP20 family molecular chaperone IbpA
MTTFLKEWTMDPFDIVWKNFMSSNSNYNTIQEKINYPVDIYETENGLCFELAVVGLDENDLEIQVESNTLRVTHEGRNDSERNYIAKGIAKRSFDLAWKVASKYDLSKLEASMDKGLLIINIPYAESKISKKIEIKINNKSLLKG